MKNDYSDIIHLERPRSKRPTMPRQNRAAQFAPYAALSGHQKLIQQSESNSQYLPDSLVEYSNEYDEHKVSENFPDDFSQETTF